MLHVCKMVPVSVGSPVKKVYTTIEVRSTLEWNLFIYSYELEPKSHPELRSLPNPIRHDDDLISIIQCVNSCTLCIGNNDEMLLHWWNDIRGISGILLVSSYS